MQIPTGELTVILTGINTVLAACKQAGSSSTLRMENETDLPAMAQALQQLADVITRVEADTQSTSDATPGDITEIGEYALQLLEALSAESGNPALNGQQQALASLAINIALWIARHGGQLETLEPVANALALMANSSRVPEELGQLSGVINEIITAVSSLISQDLEKMNPGRPWRVLLLNNSIVATRSHDTDLMEAAFVLLTSKLPEDATRFFSEGMEQMDSLDYPPHVRRVMEKYHREWPVNRSLH
ncbi:MAG: hypothetical protein ABFS24_03340 [Pseudomonadota bacterium]